MSRHNGQLPGGAKYTHARQPVKLLASCRCESKSAAYSLERTVKSEARSEKIAALQAYAGCTP
jgi:putative endonuclease